MLPCLAFIRTHREVCGIGQGYVMREYDGKRPILELLDEAAAQVVEESEKTEERPKPGLVSF